MANDRIIERVLVAGLRAVYCSRLWTPETKDWAGKPLSTPQYSITGVLDKTRAYWWEEPAFASLFAACQKIFVAEFQPGGYYQMHMLGYPVNDGDKPNQKGKVSEWAKGCWIMKASTGFQPGAFMVQNGQAVEMPTQNIGGRKIYEDGDVFIAEIGVARRLGGDAGIKAYLNAVTFTGKGERIATGGGAPDVQGMLALAAAQGLLAPQGPLGAPQMQPQMQPAPAPVHAPAAPQAPGYAPGQPAPYVPQMQPSLAPPPMPAPSAPYGAPIAPGAAPMPTPFPQR